MTTAQNTAQDIASSVGATLTKHLNNPLDMYALRDMSVKEYEHIVQSAIMLVANLNHSLASESASYEEPVGLICARRTLTNIVDALTHNQITVPVAHGIVDHMKYLVLGEVNRVLTNTGKLTFELHNQSQRAQWNVQSI